MPETKIPEIADLDQTHKLLDIAHRTSTDTSMRATHQAARAALAKSNAVIQDAIDKARKAEQEAAEKKLAEDAAAAASDKAKKAAEDAKKAADEAAKRGKAA